MTEAQAVEAICALVASEWPALQPTIPFSLPNEAALTVPTWASIEIRHRARQQVTAGVAGSRRFECRGVVIVTLYSAVDSGRSVLAGLADNVRTMLEARQIVGIVDPINTHGSATAELADNASRARVTITVPFVYITTR